MAISPVVAATDVLNRAEGLLSLDRPPATPSAREDLRRVAWAMGVASIDTYLHWAVRQVDLGASLPKKLRGLDVPFSELVEMANSNVEARKSKTVNRPMVRARNALHRASLEQTYQGSNAIKSALDMLGVDDCWAKLAGAMYSPKAKVIDRLNSMTKRRNSIVHEGDIERQSRPRKIKHLGMSEQDVRDELTWIRAFITALDTVAS